MLMNLSVNKLITTLSVFSGMASAAWWLAACALTACVGALDGQDITWPGCSTRPHLDAIEPRLTNTHVTSIRLRNCNFKTVDLNDLKHYPNVYNIDVSDIKVVNITSLTFELFANLQQLLLINTSISGSQLPSNLFQKCHSLSYVHLGGNDMSNAPADLLQGLHIRSLVLLNCSLNDVPSFFTSQLFPHMEAFYADRNKITEISPSTFVNATNITKLGLSHNLIETLDVDLLKYLTKIAAISFSYNKLRNIPEALFQYKASLEYLDLSNNQIEYISPEAFLGTNLNDVYLNDNRLTYLQQTFIINSRNNITFNFDGTVQV